MNNSGSWFKHFFSIDEAKVSVLILSLIGILTVDGIMVLRKGDVPPQLAYITVILICAVAGFNAISMVAGNISASRNGQMLNQNYPYNYSNYNSNMYNQNYNQPIQQPINNVQTNPTNMTQQPHKI